MDMVERKYIVISADFPTISSSCHATSIKIGKTKKEAECIADVADASLSSTALVMIDIAITFSGLRRPLITSKIIMSIKFTRLFLLCSYLAEHPPLSKRSSPAANSTACYYQATESNLRC